MSAYSVAGGVVPRRPRAQMHDHDQLLVATTYFTAVQAELAAMKVDVVKSEHSTILRLSRLWLGPKAGTSALYFEGTGSRRELEVGLVLQALRERFRARNQGWTPPMGKNRHVFDNVIEGGSMSYGGVGDPLPIGRFSRRKTLKSWSNRPTAPGRGVRIGMVDTVMTSAPPLAGSWYATTNDTLIGAARSLRDGHATFVAGMILSQAPGAMLDIRATLDMNGKSDSWSAAEAIVKVGRSGVDIINLSFSCLTGDGQPPLALATAVDLLDPDVLVVAAAGNHAQATAPASVVIDGQKIEDISQCVAYPAALDNVVAVGSVTANRELAFYSANAPWVDILAYGDQVTSTFPDVDKIKGFATWSGTSFAAGQVSGAIAAQTLPGLIPARQAWEEIQATAAKHPRPIARISTGAAASVPALASDYPPVLQPKRPWG